MTEVVAPAAGSDTAVKPWFDALDADTKGYITNRGLDKGDPTAAFVNAASAHRAAEKLIGVPADQIIRLPKPEDSAAWNGVYDRLGRPKDAAGYDFSAVKETADENFLKWAGETAYKLGLPKAAGETLVQEFVKQAAAGETAAAEALKATQQTELNELKKDWGVHFEVNKQLASQAALKVGVTQEALAALQAQIGYKSVMQLFHKLAVGMGEDKFVRGGGQGSDILSVDQAKDRLTALKNDQAYVKAWLAGDTEKAKEMQALHKIIAGITE